MKNLVWERASNCCEVCGIDLTNQPPLYYSVHHRHPRGMGGSKASWINDSSNLMLVCGSGTTGCHGYLESHRAWAYENGYLVPMGLYPWTVPVKLWDGRLVYLAPGSEHPDEGTGTAKA